MAEITLAKAESTARITKSNIFIVDDLPIVRQGMSQLINQESDLALCGEAGDIMHALPSIKKCRPDLIVADLSLGPVNGLKLIEELCRESPHLLVLILSMQDEALYAERCLRAGAKGYIMKQEQPDMLLLAIRKVLNGGIYISSKMGPKLINKLVSKSTGISSSTIDRLSNRELEVFQFIGQGMNTRDIADFLNLSIKTIETYIAHIKKKMCFKSSRELFLYAVQWSITERKF
jgi:DNA-binding NarL/FixJ family response regulator